MTGKAQMAGGRLTLENGLDIQLVRSARKTLLLQVREDGQVVIKAPFCVSEKEIRRFAMAHLDWLRKKQAQVEEDGKMRKTFEKSFVSGEKFLFEGREYILDLVAEKKRKRFRVERIEDTLTVEIGTVDPVQEEKAEKDRREGFLREETKRVVRKWYQEQARARLQERTAYFAEKMGETYGQIRIKEQKTRWGSCSSQKNLNFNWKLIMAPPEVLDYVVVHELCHLREMNHSARFWEEVEKILPDYKVRRAWLKKHGDELRL